VNKPVVRRTPKKTYWNEPALGWYEKIFIIEIVRGLHITGRVFFANMWKWVTGRKGAVTAYYPEERRPDYSPNNRGRHVLTLRPDGEVQCVACNLCATVCPAYCIEIVAGANVADAAHPKSPVRFDIDYARCIFCGFCVEACPEDAIRMSKDTPDLPRFERDVMWGKVDMLKAWQPASDPRKPYPAAVAVAAQPAPLKGAP
jgi:NADH-quinone oxidoreductase subunit I